MKLSVSLVEEDVAFVDDYVERTGAASRSAVIHHAIDLLRGAGLEEAYSMAWEEWDSSEDAHLWEATTEDGVIDASR